jgi:choline-sulfatase
MPTQPPIDRPNVLFIMSDQHAADVMACAGDRKAHTPNLDWLAGNGIRFANAYCNSPVCVASRMSMITGKTPSQLEVWGLSETIRSDELTWPTVLGAAGYQTAVSGRMHLWWGDKLLGFHERLSGHDATRVASDVHEFYEPGPRRDEIMANFKRTVLMEFDDNATGVGTHPYYEGDRQATDCAVDYIRQYKQGPANAPFALYTGLFCPHSPLRFPKEYFDRYSQMPVNLESLDPTLPPNPAAHPQNLRQDHGNGSRHQ